MPILTEEKVPMTELNYASIELDEKTDASERLMIPLESTFDYYIDERGHVYSEFGDRIVDVCRQGLDAAREVACFRQDIGFEVKRRELELEEACEVENLLNGEVLIACSTIPDAVRLGKTELTGYNRERNLAKVRLHEKTAQGVKTTSLSLDQSNYQALQAAMKAVGCYLPDDLTSEEVLARRYRIPADEKTKELPATIRNAYDTSLSDQLGGQWYAGGHFASEKNSLEFVSQHPDLTESHMQAVTNIMALALSGEKRQQLLEDARQNYVAALDDRLHGREVTSLGDSGARAKSEGRTFEPDCPVLSTAAQLEKQGRMQGDLLKCVTCPFCSTVVNAKLTTSGIQCPACNKERLHNGTILNHADTLSLKSSSQTKTIWESLRVGRSKQSAYRVHKEISIGGANVIIRNEAGDVIAEGRQAEKMARSL